MFYISAICVPKIQKYPVRAFSFKFGGKLSKNMDKTDTNINGVKLKVDEISEEKEKTENTVGCEHYKRKCKFVVSMHFIDFF